MKKISYEAPSVEYLDVLVEKGFAATDLQGDFEQATEENGSWS